MSSTTARNTEMASITGTWMTPSTTTPTRPVQKSDVPNSVR